jgi:hypothetical protein
MAERALYKKGDIETPNTDRDTKIKKAAKGGKPRADHKHEHKVILVKYLDYKVKDKKGNPTERCSLVDYCPICGRISNMHFFETVKQEDGCYLMLDSSIEAWSMRHPELDVYEGEVIGGWRELKNLKLVKKATVEK